MEILLPSRASVSNPASAQSLAKLERILGPNAEHLLPLYRVTDGFESVIRGGEFHLRLWPIEEFTRRREHRIVIGSDSEAADIVVNTGSEPALVQTWCTFGGGRIETLSPLLEFLAWMLEDSSSP
jgi:hypothetical protein